jgi:hypothetical protein
MKITKEIREAIERVSEAQIQFLNSLSELEALTGMKLNGNISYNDWYFKSMNDREVSELLSNDAGQYQLL